MEKLVLVFVICTRQPVRALTRLPWAASRRWEGVHAPHRHSYIYTARILIPAEWLCGSIDRLRGYGPDGDDEDAHEPANNKAVTTTTAIITPTNAGAVAGGAITVAAGAGAGAPRIPEPQLTPRQQARI